MDHTFQASVSGAQPKLKRRSCTTYTTVRQSREGTSHSSTGPSPVAGPGTCHFHFETPQKSRGTFCSPEASTHQAAQMEASGLYEMQGQGEKRSRTIRFGEGMQSPHHLLGQGHGVTHSWPRVGESSESQVFKCNEGLQDVNVGLTRAAPRRRRTGTSNV